MCIDQNHVCMIRSMTGFGSAESLTPSGRFTVEIRSVNHRFTEIVVRLPRDLSALEERVRLNVDRDVEIAWAAAVYTSLALA